MQSLGFRLLVSVAGVTAIHGDVHFKRRSKPRLFFFLKEIIRKFALIDLDEVGPALGLTEPMGTLPDPNDAVVACLEL